MLAARCEPRAGTQVALRRIAVVEQPAMLVTSPPYDPRLFVVGQAGRIDVIENDQLRAAPFLSITRAETNLDSGGEQGLLGLAFHPKYAQNGIFFIYYTTTVVTGSIEHYEVLARYRVSADPNVANKATGEVMMQVRAVGRNHNGGMIEFGPDGFLYIGIGDTSGPDGFLFSQDPQSLRGKILRIDVDAPANGKLYGIPADNPYAAGGGLPEIYLSGLRNPWRWSFDRKNYDMYIADVGQDVMEELTILTRPQSKGANLGWYPIEGDHCVAPPCDSTGKTAPQVTKTQATDNWCAIVGGQVYRGPCMPDLVGTYFFSDYCAGGLWTLKAENGVVTSSPTAMPGTFPPNISSIHADERGELFATNTNGEVFQLEVAP
ncbi:MAG: PQQ-dependent sugar dehydrogenase [Deltaproteobacteria bacterium]|nr:PQQ-dependent sugar dehydrogenase [Deltaproteobacteria bacterium]